MPPSKQLRPKLLQQRDICALRPRILNDLLPVVPFRLVREMPRTKGRDAPVIKPRAWSTLLLLPLLDHDKNDTVSKKLQAWKSHRKKVHLPRLLIDKLEVAPSGLIVLGAEVLQVLGRDDVLGRRGVEGAEVGVGREGFGEDLDEAGQVRRAGWQERELLLCHGWAGKEMAVECSSAVVRSVCVCACVCVCKLSYRHFNIF